MEQETVEILYNTMEDHMLQIILSIIIFINRYNCLWVVSSSFTVRVKFSRVELSYPVTGEQLLLLPLSLSLFLFLSKGRMCPSTHSHTYWSSATSLHRHLQMKGTREGEVIGER